MEVIETVVRTVENGSGLTALKLFSRPTLMLQMASPIMDTTTDTTSPLADMTEELSESFKVADILCVNRFQDTMSVDI